MSVSGISGNMQSQMQEMQQEFQQLGGDLSSGNLSAAQTDFATLQSDMPQPGATNTTATTAQNSNPISQDFSQLSQDLQAGNLSAAQQDYSNIQQAFQSMRGAHGHHHHHGSGGGEQSQFSQLFSQLGQDLQSGDLSSAQSVWTSLQQLMQGNSSSTSSSGSTYTPVSVSA